MSYSLDSSFATQGLLVSKFGRPFNTSADRHSVLPSIDPPNIDRIEPMINKSNERGMIILESSRSQSSARDLSMVTPALNQPSSTPNPNSRPSLPSIVPASNDRSISARVEPLVRAALPNRRSESSTAITTPTPTPPTIQVKIGRIEIRAVTNSSPPAPRSRPSNPTPQMSLADYLKARGGG